MEKRKYFRQVVLVLALFLFASGFLGFCQGPDYVPCSIQFIDPPNGAVLESGTTSVTVHGKVVAGSKQPLLLKAFNEEGKLLGTVSYNKTTGDFAYLIALKAKQYTTVTFEVIDASLIGNKQRISFAVGESSVPGAPNVVDNAARLMLTDDFMNQVEVVAAQFLNLWKNDFIYGTNNPESPFYGSTPLLPLQVNDIPVGDYIRIDPAMGGDHKGYVNLGTVSLAIDIQAGGVINADLHIAPVAGVNPRNPGNSSKAIFVQGHHQYWFMGDPHFTLMADAVHVTNAKLKLKVDSDNKIAASLDLSGANLQLSNPIGEYGILDIPEWLMSWIIDMVKDDLLSALSLDIPIIDADSIVMPPFAGIQAGGWPMNTSTIFTSTNSDMTIDLGISAELADGVSPLIPGLDAFYSTPGDDLPALATAGTENVQLAISDDIVNNLAFVAIQAGLVNQIDITASFKDELGDLSPKNLLAIVTLDTPPIVDFSGDPLEMLLGSFDAGRVIIRNLKIQIFVKTVLPPYPIAMTLSADVNAALKLDLSEDGKRIVVGIDTEQSDSRIVICYDNLGNAIFARAIGKDIANSVIDGALRGMLSFEIPSLDLYGTSVNIALIGSELSNNCLIAKARITH